MSRETLTSLNTNVLIGHTEHRGTAWHYRAEQQGSESNHYPGPIPVADVHRRLFNWTPESRTLAVEVASTVDSMTHLDHEGWPARWLGLTNRQAITCSDNQHVMGIFSRGYQPHPYDEWLLTSVANILDDTLSISSAGLLRGGAVAWVEVGVPDSIETPEGFEFRPNLLATTSFDGSIATTYKRTVTATVCDNTRDLALGESGQQIKVKHSRNSALRLADARQALAMVHSMGYEFAAEVAELCRTPVNAAQWDQFLAASVPIRAADGSRLAGRALTMAETKRDLLDDMYRNDPRTSPWHGTAFGVLQTVNTYEHHEARVRGATRAERNMLKTVTGEFSRLDATTWQRLQSVLN
ncbi:DUF932 domain-containing protein [Aeromicrobium sp.]|uniref:DUF932 domain-containing protein n=1 Tax=Aeromicrobium sp. TaxID=1871063 RepID=UPI0040337F79